MLGILRLFWKEKISVSILIYESIFNMHVQLLSPLQGFNSPMWSNRGGWAHHLQRLLLPGGHKTCNAYCFLGGIRRFKIVCAGSVH